LWRGNDEEDEWFVSFNHTHLQFSLFQPSEPPHPLPKLQHRLCPKTSVWMWGSSPRQGEPRCQCHQAEILQVSLHWQDLQAHIASILHADEPPSNLPQHLGLLWFWVSSCFLLVHIAQQVNLSLALFSFHFPLSLSPYLTPMHGCMHAQTPMSRSLICRPLPLDVGRCTCLILKEPTPQGLSGGTFFSLYTNVIPLNCSAHNHFFRLTLYDCGCGGNELVRCYVWSLRFLVAASHLGNTIMNLVL